ncbi:hypothetical protein G6011_01723 [Alternaria panax]|uniref:RRM domain-containing protein n=1 Tax=Alternaria panax TaxID=48097 RepID=A0AAD4IKH2_9PLEO|nr:hypothetical protein G6011_01723 [Alternaria panax]
MKCRDRTTANLANGLLSRQFVSITDVLFKASQRRDRELQELQQRLLRPVPTPPAFKPASEPPVAAEPELSQGSDSGDDHIELEQVDQSNKDIVDDELTVAAPAEKSSDMAETHVHLPGGYVLDHTGDHKMMLAELNSSNPRYSSSGAKGEPDDNYDLERMLADMKRVSSSTRGTAVDHDNDPKIMPADPSMKEADDLSALAKRLGIDSNESAALEDAKSRYDDLDNQEQAVVIRQSEDEDDDLENLCRKLATMFSPFHDTASQDLPHTAKDTSVINIESNPREEVAGRLEPEYTPSAVALRLEAGDAEWKDVEAGRTQSFSDGIDKQEAEKEKEDMWKRENEKLEATIKYVLEEDKRYRAIEETRRLSTRLIVSNLAADVDDKAIRMFFSRYITDVRNITILSKRDPVKRTRTAYVDMYSRKVAVHASYEVGGIFGLIVKIKLAVE